MLEILGIVFLVLIALVLTFLVWVGLKIYRGVKEYEVVAAIEEGMDTPPIALQPNEHPDFLFPEAVAELVAQAVRVGATRCGAYDVPGANARLIAYAMSTPPIYIVIYDHDQVEPWMDVLLLLEGDRTFTASTVPEIGRGAPRPPEDEILHFAPGTVMGVLVQAAEERAAEDQPLPALAERFKEHFEAASEKSRQYIKSQSVSQEWLEQIANDAGVELTGSEAAQINLGREAEQYTQIQAACIKALAESGEFTAAQWDELRDRLVAVWDGMPNDWVPGVFYDFVEVPEELEDAVDDLEESRGPARERIARFNQRLPENLRLVPIGTVSTPVVADIYKSQVDFDAY